MSFLPSMKPGNIRAPITTSSKYFGNTNDTFHYSPAPGQIPINKTNPCSGNTEIVAGVIKIYEPHRFGAPDSPNFVDTTTNNGLNAEPLSGLGHNNHLNVRTEIHHGSDTNFRINYDESPAAVFHTLAEGSYAYNYNYYNMKSSTTAEDDKGVYRQAAFRIVHSAANEGNENACFDRMDFASDAPNEINYTYNNNADDAPYTYGTPIVDLHVNLTDPPSGTRDCQLGISYKAGNLYLCERLDINNTVSRPLRASGDLGTTVAGFYRGMRNLVDTGKCPYFLTTHPDRNGMFRRCPRVTHLDDTFADPARAFVPHNCTGVQQMFFHCSALRYLPANIFTWSLDSPNDYLET